MTIENLLPAAEQKQQRKEPVRAAIFMSGSGTNAEKVIEQSFSCWLPAVIITDAPRQSRAAAIAARFDLPLIALDIKEFYRQHGETKVSLRTEAGRHIRELWSNALRRLIARYQPIDFGILAGFSLLTNLTGDFPCLNIHPGDLTIECNGHRLLVGLHTVPVETAILNGFSHLRSSVILAQPYIGQGQNMDAGPILGISAPVAVDLLGSTLEELKLIRDNRLAAKPSGGYKDRLETVAIANQENLKQQGDWQLFPRVVSDFAAGKFGGVGNQLYYWKDGCWHPVKTLEYAETVSLIP